MHSLIDVFNLFAGRQGDVAFIYRTGVRRFIITYQELTNLVLKFNKWLEQQNIKPGDRVAIWAPNSPWWAVAYWGCVTRGAVVVPIDFMAGLERAEKIIKYSGASLIIQSRYKIDRLPQAQNTIEIEQLEFVLNKLEPADKLNDVKADDMVEIVYTSGTTGNPKGVVLTHKNLIANLKQVLKQIEIKPEYTFLSLLPLSHMFEQMGGFLAPLRVGGQIIYLRSPKPSTMSEALAQEDINVIMTVPRILQAMKDSVIRELKHKKIFWLFNYLIEKFRDKDNQFKHRLFFPVHKKFGRNFQFFVSGGASLAISTFKFWQDIGFKVIEGYGLTECSPVLAANTLNQQTAGSVGTALPGIEIRLSEGEVQARGDNIFSGYWDNPQATLTAFTKDGWFKTGDLGEYDKDGNLYIKGRSKDIIVTAGGINAYPDEIEEVINGIPGVVESCVLGHDRGRGEEIYAVLILEEGRRAEEIINIANRQLDPKQRISGYSVWPESTFPKTTTLKVRKFEVKGQLKNQTDHRVLRSADKLKELIAFVTKKFTADIVNETRPVVDLGLSSIARLELANLIEIEYRLDFDDSLITSETTVEDLQRLVEQRAKHKHYVKSRSWVHNKIVRHFRYYFNQIISRQFFKLFFSLKVKNKRNLNTLKGPVIFIANHASYIDGHSVYFALPKKWRLNFSAPVYEDFFFNKKNLITKFLGRFWFELLSFVTGLFLATEGNGFRKVLEFMGDLVERDVNILIFPEGERSKDNKLLPFQPGLGQMVNELKVPVVPIKITGAYQLLPRGRFLPRRGSVIVEFGQPLNFTHETSEEIINKARQALLNM